MWRNVPGDRGIFRVIVAFRHIVEMGWIGHKQIRLRLGIPHHLVLEFPKKHLIQRGIDSVVQGLANCLGHTSLLKRGKQEHLSTRTSQHLLTRITSKCQYKTRSMK
jgi:hypothetical protein